MSSQKVPCPECDHKYHENGLPNHIGSKRCVENQMQDTEAFFGVHSNSKYINYVKEKYGKDAVKEGIDYVYLRKDHLEEAEKHVLSFRRNGGGLGGIVDVKCDILQDTEDFLFCRSRDPIGYCFADSDIARQYTPDDISREPNYYVVDKDGVDTSRRSVVEIAPLRMDDGYVCYTSDGNNRVGRVIWGGPEGPTSRYIRNELPELVNGMLSEVI